MIERNDPKFREQIEKGLPLERLERRLRPESGSDDWDAERSQHDGFGDYSHKGFLGADESLLDVVYDDWAVVERFGTTHQKIAEALGEAIKAKKMPNPEYAIQQDISTLGLQRCPWECDGRYERGNGIILIYNVQRNSQQDLMAVTMSVMMGNRLDEMEEEMAGFSKDAGDLSDRVVVVTELHPHLIGEHHFFEGKQSPYRADPRVLVHSLNLARHP
jgi:hypothetical protein